MINIMCLYIIFTYIIFRYLLSEFLFKFVVVTKSRTYERRGHRVVRCSCAVCRVYVCVRECKSVVIGL